MKAASLPVSPSAIEPRLADASRLLGALANGRRLMALCHLHGGEKSVGELANLVGLAPAALSQHLARMRALRLVATRREGQTIYYRVANDEVRAMLDTLHRLYCASEA
ncbi:ArsR/SmtB family transcription factor [Elioraea rosea]|uniref:ArsR/SmtB family transcription factor n=1 Tax=Elioraea rosea TaxID=2492390 RepID=UPI001181F76F|nr:metalloregulator ArsR/SmtB family transcription factor [Elioraea rosea]